MDREEIKLRLSQIEAANNGRLTPEDVVEDARDPQSPLHGLFEWDVDKAAQQAWIARARSIIASVRVEVVTDTLTVRAPAYIRDPRVPPREQGYVAASSLRKNQEAAQQAALRELRNAEGALLRARSVAAILDVEREVEEAQRVVRTLRDRVAGEIRAAS